MKLVLFSIKIEHPSLYGEGCSYLLFLVYLFSMRNDLCFLNFYQLLTVISTYFTIFLPVNFVILADKLVSSIGLLTTLSVESIIMLILI